MNIADFIFEPEEIRASDRYELYVEFKLLTPVVVAVNAVKASVAPWYLYGVRVGFNSIYDDHGKRHFVVIVYTPRKCYNAISHHWIANEIHPNVVYAGIKSGVVNKPPREFHKA